MHIVFGECHRHSLHSTSDGYTTIPLGISDITNGNDYLSRMRKVAAPRRTPRRILSVSQTCTSRASLFGASSGPEAVG
eukprot:scaffold3953_cov169-Amphora_coffeaeformis.AAC.22